MNIILKGFFYDKGKVRALGTIAVVIFPLVLMLFDRIGKHLFGLIDLHADFGQIGQLHRSAILGDQCLQIEAIELKGILFNVKPVLGKVEGLLHQVGVGIVH